MYAWAGSPRNFGRLLSTGRSPAPRGEPGSSGVEPRAFWGGAGLSSQNSARLLGSFLGVEPGSSAGVEPGSTPEEPGSAPEEPGSAPAEPGSTPAACGAGLLTEEPRSPTLAPPQQPQPCHSRPRTSRGAPAWCRSSTVVQAILRAPTRTRPPRAAPRKGARLRRGGAGLHPCGGARLHPEEPRSPAPLRAPRGNLGPSPRGLTGCAGFVHPSHPTRLNKRTFPHLWAW